MVGASDSFINGDSVEHHGAGGAVADRAGSRVPLCPWTDAWAGKDIVSKALVSDSALQH